jgi:hypothetical protein
MNKKRNPFRLRATSPQPEEPRPKLAEEMTDSELEEGIRKARREILDAQHDELRIREKARMVPGDAPGSGRAKPRNLGEIFSKNKRRFK